MFDAADLAAFFDPDMPGFVLATIGSNTVPALFTDPGAAYQGVAGSNPVLTCSVADAAAISPGSTLVTLGASQYLAREVRHRVGFSPTTGIATVELERQ